jgi:outer membrane protein TolC
VENGNEYVTTADMYRAGSLRYLAEGEKVGLEHVCQRAYSGLRLAMGVDQQSMFQIADQRLVVGQKDLDATVLLRQAIVRRPDLAKADIGVKVAALEQQVAKAAFYPEIGAFASFSTVNDDGHYANPNQRDQTAVGISGQIPLFAGGRRLAQSRQANCQQAQATQVRQFLTEQVSQEVHAACLEYREASERLRLETQGVRQAIQALKTYDAQLTGGLIEAKNMPKYFEDLILTRRMLTEALARYYQSVYNCNMALGRIRLVTACDEYQTFVESGGTDARVLDDGGAAAVRDDRR